jgi:septal ring factor EnvC (AmiA/AmiB activator)
MKSKLVLWGKNPSEERVLLALDLLEDSNKIDVHVIPEALVTQELENQLLHDWKDDNSVQFPEGSSALNIDLKLIGDLLPEGFSVEKEDLLKRAQAEWHFVVLSSKLYKTYHSEIEEIKDRIEQAGKYSVNAWDELKNFWDKVQGQIMDRNIFRSHAAALKEQTNNMFTRLKELRKDLDKEFNDESKTNFEKFNAKLEEIEERITKGLSLHVLFEDLKQLQNKLKDIRFSKDHRNKVWARIDEAFKIVKEKRFGPDSKPTEASDSNNNRIEKRLIGLLDAIKKMQNSIRRDKEEINFQDKRVGESGGMLEAQLREAKIKMVQERIDSKELKLADMLATKAELESKLANIKEKDKKRAELEDAKKAAQDKIAAEIKEAAEQRKEEEGKLEKAAAAIVGPKDMHSEEANIAPESAEVNSGEGLSSAEPGSSETSVPEESKAKDSASSAEEMPSESIPDKSEEE